MESMRQAGYDVDTAEGRAEAMDALKRLAHGEEVVPPGAKRYYGYGGEGPRHRSSSKKY
jgi:hypothetical protein